MEGCKKALKEFNERQTRALFQSIKHGGGIVYGDITSCTIPEMFVPKELVEKLDACGLLDENKDNSSRNLTPEAIETFKNMEARDSATSRPTITHSARSGG